MGNTSKIKKPTRRDAAYYRQRQKNQVYSCVLGFFEEEAATRGITKKDWADAMGKDPAQATRWLKYPSNLELDTISDMLLPFGAEMEHRIVRFSDRPRPNYAHTLMRVGSPVVQPLPKSPTATSQSSNLSNAKTQSKVKFEGTVTVSGV